MMDISIEKQANGSLLFSTIWRGIYYKQVYYFYSTRAALADFKRYVLTN